jgi:hypothetical protein
VDQTYEFTAAKGLQNISGGFPSPLTVYNGGTVQIQVTDDVNGTSDGFPLSPGTSIVWDAGRPLCAFVPVGTPGQAALTILDNSGAISNPSAIASALLVGGLAGAIASAIAVQGAPPLNAFDILKKVTLRPFNAGTTSVDDIDVHKYNAISIWSYFTNTGAGTTPPGYRYITLDWYTDDAGALGALIVSNTYYLTDDAAGAGVSSGSYDGTTIQVPVRGYWLRLSYLPTPMFLNAGFLTFNVVGRYAAQPVPFVNVTNPRFGSSGMAVDPAPDKHDGLVWMSGAKAAALLQEFPFILNVGPAQLHVAVNNVTVAPLEVVLLDAIDLKRIASSPIFPVAAGVVSSDTRQIMLPNVPFIVQIAAGPVATSVSVSLTYLDRS